MQQLSNLMSQTKDIGDWTRALHIGNLQRQVRDLEADVEKLCHQTEDVQVYRDKNEARLTELFREVLASKEQGKQVKELELEMVSLKKLLKETGESVTGFRAEMDVQRKIVREAQELSAGLQDPDEIYRLMLQHPQLQDEAKRHLDQNDSQQSSCAETGIDPDTGRRIKEAIASTGRWNAQHKTTQLDDSEFIKNYLEKQASRDMQIAQIVQRALARLLIQKGLTSTSKSLVHFCSNLTWDDVTSTFKKLFGKRRMDTARKLARGRK